MRGFLAIPIPKDICDNIGNKIAQLKTNYPGLRWVAEENYHLTLAFLGDISSEQFQELDDSLEGIKFPSVFTLQLTRFGTFPEGGKVRVFWLGFTQPPELVALYKTIQDKAFEKKLLDRKTIFKPHLTLARSKDGQPLSGHALPQIDIPPFQVQGFNFYKSELKPSGAVYTIVKKYLLT